MPPEPLWMLTQKERGKMAGVGTRGHITPVHSDIHRRGNCRIHIQTQPRTYGCTREPHETTERAHEHARKEDRRKETQMKARERNTEDGVEG